MTGPYAHVVEAKWWLLFAERGCVLGLVCLHNHLWYTPLAFVDFKHETPGPKECPAICHIVANPLNVGE